VRKLIMKILMLGWELPPHNSGGLGVACYHMSKALAIEGAEIDFVLPYEADYSSISFMKVHPATNLPASTNTSFGAYHTTFTSEDAKDLALDARNIRSVQRAYMEFVEVLSKKSAPDVIHAHDWLTIEAGIRARELTNASLVVHVHATEFDRSGSERGGNPLIHEIEYQGLLMADRIIAVSQNTKDLIVRKYQIPADKIEVVHNALDLDSFKNDNYSYDTNTYRYLSSLKDEGYTIFTAVTRLTVQKGLTHLLRAFARAAERYEKIALLLAGDGEQRDELIQLAADLGISDKLFFTGFVRGHKWRSAYGVADVFVMSSVSEPFGLTALEAAHHDNAIILTKQSGAGEVLPSVFRYDFWDEERLANQIVGVASSPVLRDSLKENVRNEYARISWRDVAQQCLDMYQTRVKVATA
jgi:glycogen(starch) synthase